MSSPVRVLLQTTIAPLEDDWGIARFGLLRRLLSEQRDQGGEPLFEVTARDRDPAGAPDAVLSRLDETDFDQLWLFAVDTGDGLTKEDCAAIGRFRKRSGGLMVTRDHMDLGCSICTLGGVGEAHRFHTKNLDPDESRRVIDDPYTAYILWPNYHSGANGDFQQVEIEGPVHPVLADPGSPGGAIRLLPTHPHEGAVVAPPGEPAARVIATGRSKITGARFNLAVAFEPAEEAGPAIAEATFHRFADYNWDPAAGAPSFVDEPPGDGMVTNPDARRSAELYALNIAHWLAQRRPPTGLR